MMMNPAKRRCVHNANSTLVKPFRSPLKLQDSEIKAKQEQTKDDDNEQQSPIRPASEPTIERASSRQVDTSATPVPDDDQPNPTFDDIDKLQRDYAALGLQLRRRRQDLDVLQQAQTFRSSKQEEKLAKLIMKWRSIARDAADELFESTSCQINDMGGLQAWKKHNSTDHIDGWYDSKDEHPSSHSCDKFEDKKMSQLEQEQMHDVISKKDDVRSTQEVSRKGESEDNRSLLIFYSRTSLWMSCCNSSMLILSCSTTMLYRSNGGTDHHCCCTVPPISDFQCEIYWVA